ncbi:MAG: hypothetical protein OQK82_03500 [Candidatus Pacearchaeota archaeon]|nr:hypothetical protein [Candidatus Pacearchaeota archaeon]
MDKKQMQEFLMNMQKNAEKGIYFNPITQEMFTTNPVDAKAMLKEFMSRNKNLIWC